LLCIRFVILGASSLRAASSTLNLTFQTLPELKKYIAPSPTTIKRWLQKVGYFKLKHPKAIANDWMLIVDASIQMGAQKCLLFLGCRLSDLPKNHALTLQDLEILSLRIVSNLNSKLITQELQNIKSMIGKIICVCCDQGSDMIRGVKDFQLISPETRLINDTAHKVANILEGFLEKNERWIKFREQVTQSRRKMQNSLVAGALAPSPRTKARYMNVDSLIKWAADMLILLDNGTSTSELDIDELKKYLSWLFNYRDNICYWNRLIAIGGKARDLVRLEGIHINTSEHFEDSTSSIEMGHRELQFADKISSFLLKQTHGIMQGEHFIGSTEVLESLFGKFKFMEKEQTAFGFTSLVLAAAACVGPIDEKSISEAVVSIKQSEIDEWSKKEVGMSIQSQRTAVRKIITNLKLKMDQNISGILEEKVVGF
jgi:hypothetical protein